MVFAFGRVTDNDGILAISYFRSQTAGEDGIIQNIIAKALPTISPYLIKLFNASLLKWFFPIRLEKITHHSTKKG